MANNNTFDQTVNSLFHGLDNIMSTKTVVGEPEVIGDTIILPLVDVSFGMGAGAFNKEKSSNGAGGIGGKMSPCAVLVINKGEARLVNVRNQDAITKVLDMVPGTVNKITSIIRGESSPVDEDVEEAVKGKMDQEESIS